MIQDTKPHHHGNLREALILAGIELLEKYGVAGLSLRKCAALAGVSHAAPAHHFNGLTGLKAALVARGHKMFSATMLEFSGAAPTDPQAQLHAICDGYIDFARNHTALFKFMFHPHDLDKDSLMPATQAELKKHARKSYAILSDCCAPFGRDDAERQETEIMIWSLVHGYAMLFGGSDKSPTPNMTLPDFAKILPKLQLKTTSGR